MGKIRTKHVLIMVAQEQKKKFCLMDEILQWSFTSRRIHWLVVSLVFILLLYDML
jgi:hypothetical protein